MEIILNNKIVIVDDKTTIEKVITYFGMNPVGIAIAVNNKIVSRNDWNKTILNNGDKVVMIKGACGG
ncbi:MAG: sulfur carrier protein ThiS [Bacteroidales bacterium]